MPYDSNGVFSLTPGYLAIAGQTIQPSQHNPPLEDIVGQGLSNVLVRDGRAPMVGNLKMNTFRITGMGDGASAMDAVTKQQMDTAVTGATDSVAYNAMKFSTKSGTYTAVKADNATAFRFTAAATLNLTAAATLGANWWCEIQATNGNVVIDPNAAETVDGAATVVVQSGQIARVYCNGTSFATEFSGDPLAGPQLQGFSYGLGLSTNVTDAANDVDIAAGAAGSDTSPFYLMQLGTALTKRLDANWAFGNNQGGLDTGSVSAAATYYIWLIQRSDTLVVDALFSLSSTAPTMPANYDRKRRIGVVSRVASVNSTPDSILIDAIGIGQTWQIPTRAAGSVYQNTTGRSIQVHVSASRAGPANAFFKVSADNITWVNVAVARTSSSDGNVSVLHASIIIPPGFYYQVTGAALDFGTWSELRA